MLGGVAATPGLPALGLLVELLIHRYYSPTCVICFTSTATYHLPRSILFVFDVAHEHGALVDIVELVGMPAPIHP